MRHLWIVLLLLTPTAAQEPAPLEGLPAYARGAFAAVHAAAEARSPQVTEARVDVRRSPSARAWAELATRVDGSHTQWISVGLLEQLEALAPDREPTARREVARRVLTLILARQIVDLYADDVYAETARVFADVEGEPPTAGEAQAAFTLLTESRGLEIECRPAPFDMGPMRCRFVDPDDVTRRHGTVDEQVARLLRAVPPAARGVLQVLQRTKR